MSVSLSIEGKLVTGEVALDVHPAMTAAERDRALDAALSERLTELATELGVVLASAAHRYAKPIPGKDAAGKTRFAIVGRAEGDHLVPVRKGG
ncbi:MAG: hypothetical protein JNL38_18205 [Myxococcales bacterium]|nr:hypothetical protein [Myxococcales bacterium]